MIYGFDSFEWSPASDSDVAHWRTPPGATAALSLTPAPAFEAAQNGGAPWGVLFCAFRSLPKRDTFVPLATGNDPRNDKNVDGRFLDAAESLLGFRPEGETIADVLYSILTTGADPSGDGINPLMPELNWKMPLWADGTLLRRDVLTQLHPHWSKVVSRIKRELSELRARSIAGKMVNAATKEIDRGYFRRCADKRLEELAGPRARDKAKLWEVIRPADWPVDETPEPHATTISDNFNRADNASLGNSSEGWSWTEVTGNTDIASNAASPTSTATANINRAESDLSSSNHYSQSTLTAGASTTSNHLSIVRFDAASQQSIQFFSRRNTTNTYRLFKSNTLGALTQIGSTVNTTSPASGSTSKVDVTGANAITGYNNGSAVIGPSTDSAGSTNTRCGMGGSSISGGAMTIDDFVAGDLASGLIYTQLERSVRGMNRGIALGGF